MILSYDSLVSLRDVIASRKDLNAFARFCFKENSLSFNCMDTFYLTQCSVHIPASHYKETTQNPNLTYPTTSIHLDSEEGIFFVENVASQKRALLIRFDDNTPIEFRDPNTSAIFVTIPYMNDACLKYITPSFDNVFCIRYLASDLMTSLLNLSLCDAIMYVQLHDKELRFRTTCEVGTIEVKKKLNVNDTNFYFECKYGIKHIKVFSNLISNTKECILKLDPNTKQLHIAFSNRDTNGIFTLCPYPF
jgi:hypothetical protein